MILEKVIISEQISGILLSKVTLAQITDSSGIARIILLNRKVYIIHEEKQRL